MGTKMEYNMTHFRAFENDEFVHVEDHWFKTDIADTIELQNTYLSMGFASTILTDREGIRMIVLHHEQLGWRVVVFRP